jgi:hypothetical protein
MECCRSSSQGPIRIERSREVVDCDALTHPRRYALFTLVEIAAEETSTPPHRGQGDFAILPKLGHP